MNPDYGWMEFRFDQGRLDRSREIAVVGVDIDGNPLPEKHYMAFGSNNHHYCHTDDGVECDCNDFAWGGNERLCKHLIATLLHEGDLLMAMLVGDV
jgi:hypothetical protein